MIILSIETSCDETSAAVTGDRRILSNIVSSQIDVHKKYGGVVPALAKREHQKRLPATIKAALGEAGATWEEIGYLAVTHGPGLSLALGVGVTQAKELAQKHHKKLVAVNHLEAHLLSSLASDADGQGPIEGLEELKFPLLGFIVSGGHTQLILLNRGNPFKRVTPICAHTYSLLGTTLDDAAGEALDKFAKLLGLGYPGGPVIEKRAKEGDPAKFKFPRPLSSQKDTYNFSFSGLKTAGKYQIRDLGGLESLSKQDINDLCASYQEAVFDSLIIKARKALEDFPVKGILAGGGVVINKRLQAKLQDLAGEFSLPIYVPQSNLLLADNAGIVGVAAYFKALRGEFSDPVTLDWNPRLGL